MTGYAPKTIRSTEVLRTGGREYEYVLGNALISNLTHPCINCAILDD